MADDVIELADALLEDLSVGSVGVMRTATARRLPLEVEVTPAGARVSDRRIGA